MYVLCLSEVYPSTVQYAQTPLSGLSSNSGPDGRLAVIPDPGRTKICNKDFLHIKGIRLQSLPSAKDKVVVNLEIAPDIPCISRQVSLFSIFRCLHGIHSRHSLLTRQSPTENRSLGTLHCLLSFRICKKKIFEQIDYRGLTSCYPLCRCIRFSCTYIRHHVPSPLFRWPLLQCNNHHRKHTPLDL